jgi:hypothetical protein
MNTKTLTAELPAKTLDPLEEAKSHITFLRQELSMARALWQDGVDELERLRGAWRIEKDARERIQRDYVEIQRRPRSRPAAGESSACRGPA